LSIFEEKKDHFRSPHLWNSKPKIRVLHVDTGSVAGIKGWFGY